MPSKQMIWYVGLFLAGVVLADKVRTLPGLNRLPAI
jgi:hypothetical protein